MPASVENGIKLMIHDKIIWITGASSGIGKSVAMRLAQQKNQVFVTGRNSETLAVLANEYPKYMVAVVADVTKEASMREAYQFISQQVDHIDMLICCAGTCEYQDGKVFDVELYRRVMDTNFLGTVNSVNVALPLLEASNQEPLIVGVSSLSVLVPFPRAEAYGASKAAMEYFLASLRIDLQATGIDVAIIRPGFVDTPLTRNNDFDMPFLMSSAKACDAILYAIGRRRQTFNFPFKLSFPLSLFAFFPVTWEKYIAPKFRKSEAVL